jgi:F-type H+-transporting ATPase subunit b
MPQLNVTLFPSQILWLLLAFLTLYLYLKHIALPKVEGVIKRRGVIIESDVMKTAALKDEAALLQQQCINESLKTSEQVEEIHNQIMLRVAADKKERLENIHQRFLLEQHKQNTDILEAQKIAATEMPQAVVEYASFIITKITGIKPKVEDLRLYNKELRSDA